MAKEKRNSSINIPMEKSEIAETTNHVDLGCHHTILVEPEED